jgi:hypothetical protein
MITRLCDGCREVIKHKTFVQLTKGIFETDKDNHQIVEHVIGDYCDKCLKDGEALKDLLGDFEAVI